MTRSGMLWLELALAAQDSHRRKKLKKFAESLSWEGVDFELATLCLEATRYFVRWKAEAIEIDPRIIEILAPPQLLPDVAKAKLVGLVARRLSLIEGLWAPSIQEGRVEIRFTANDPDCALEANTWEAMIQFVDACSARGLRLLLCDHCGVTFFTEIKSARYHSPRCGVMTSKQRGASDFYTDSATLGQTL